MNQERHAAALRDTLVSTATAMLASGVTEISLRAVSREANVSAMAPYRHFDSKSALLSAVATDGFGVLHRALLAANAEGSARERLVRQGMAYVRFATENPALFRLMFADRTVAPIAPDCRGKAYEVLADCVREFDNETADLTALTCWATVHGIAMLALDTGDSAFGTIEIAAVLQSLAARL